MNHSASTGVRPGFTGEGSHQLMANEQRQEYRDLARQPADALERLLGFGAPKKR
jgi:hypothetical protein